MGYVLMRRVRPMGTLAQASEGAAGYDLTCCLSEPVMLYVGHRVLVPCGIALEMTTDIEAQVRPRSGLALRHGVTCLNAPGTIDSDYRGEIHALLVNLGNEPVTISPGERVAQLVFARVYHPHIEETDELSETERGEGGFGSTGR